MTVKTVFFFTVNFTNENKGFPDPPKKRKNHNYVSSLVHLERSLEGNYKSCC